MHSSDLLKVPQPSPEMTSQRRAVDHFGLRGSGSDSKLPKMAPSPSTVSQNTLVHVTYNVFVHSLFLNLHVEVCSFNVG